MINDDPNRKKIKKKGNIIREERSARSKENRRFSLKVHRTQHALIYAIFHLN